jgi:hypothetical protein
MANQYQTIAPATQRKIAGLFQKGLSSREVGRQVKIDHVTCLRYKHGPARPEPKTPEQLEDAIRAALKRGPITANDLAAGLDVSVPTVRRVIATLQGHGAMIIELPGGAYEIASSAILEPRRHELSGAPKAEWTHHLGITSDNHLCNRQSRLDVLHAAYDHFERQGIRTVFNAGNWIDGEARFNKTELLTAPGMDNQLDYLIDKWPVRKGITTQYIAGDDHEGWYQQREGVEVGQYLQMRAEKQGRHDLKYLGYAECDVALRCGTGAAVARIVHPGGGSAYATSYTAQKLVESYQGGEKPQVLIIGHYHKAEYGYPREVHCLQTGCTEDQSLFMRKKKIAAHVGFWEVKIKQNAQGVITRFATEWFPFFDRGFYERRYR